MTIIHALHALQQQAAWYAQQDQPFPLTGEGGLIDQLTLLLAQLRRESSGIDGSVQLHAEEGLAAHLHALPDRPLDEAACAQAGRDLLLLTARLLDVPEFAALRAGYGLGWPQEATLYRDERLHLHLRGNRAYLALQGDARLFIEGETQMQYCPESGGDQTPLQPPLPYTLTAGPLGPDLEFWHHKGDDDPRAGSASIITEFGHGHLRAVVHGREREELCEVVFDQDTVHVGQPWLSEASEQGAADVTPR